MGMGYRYRSARYSKRLARKSRRNFLITLIIIIALIYTTITWILPNFVSGIGFVKNIIKPAQKAPLQSSDTSPLAPPVLNIPFEATNSAQINIKGFGTPNSQVKLYLDDDLKQTIDTESDGSFNFEDVSLFLGTNNIYGKTVDQGKESLPSKTIRLVYINEKPNLAISEPEDNKKIQGGDKKVKVSGKTNPGVKVFVNGTQAIIDFEGNFKFDVTLNEGDNTISVKAVDVASNTTEIQRRVIYNP